MPAWGVKHNDLRDERGRARSGVVPSQVLRDWADATETEQTRPLDDHAPPPSVEGPCAGMRFAGRYELIREIGAGGMSSVWEGIETLPNGTVRVVALKIVRSGLPDVAATIPRFEQEARIAHTLKGRGFPRIYDWGSWRGTSFMALELLDGEDLFQRLERESMLSPWETLALLKQLARALDAVHETGVVHRDVKPKNIFFARDGRVEHVKLLDFGVAKHAIAAHALTQPGYIVGSPHFMSPEQARSGALDHRADLWSLGVVLYRALTGARPFEGTFVQVIKTLLTERFAPVTRVRPELPAALDGFFERALAKDPTRRFDSAGEMAEAFEWVLSAADLSAIQRGQRGVRHGSRPDDLTTIERAPEPSPPTPRTAPRLPPPSRRVAAVDPTST